MREQDRGRLERVKEDLVRYLGWFRKSGAERQDEKPLTLPPVPGAEQRSVPVTEAALQQAFERLLSSAIPSCFGHPNNQPLCQQLSENAGELAQIAARVIFEEHPSLITEHSGYDDLRIAVPVRLQQELAQYLGAVLSEALRYQAGFASGRIATVFSEALEHGNF
ncbi:MAG: hypothetical protein K1X83_04400 [Oligoflexia bacterium]|nr:hypothetical protein [Oligoflexia bacterium]